MKIQLVSLTLYPDARGGRARYARELFEILRKRGHSVNVVTGLWSQHLEEPNIIQVPIVKRRFLWFPTWTFLGRRLIGKGNPDIIHINTSRETLACIGKKINYITAIHDIGPFELGMKTLQFLVRRNVSKSDIILVPTKAVKKMIQKLFPAFDPENIVVIPLGVSERFFQPPKFKNYLREKYNLTGPIILYLGRVARYKGVLNVIKASKIVRQSHPEANLVIAGGPSVKMQDTYNAWKRRFPEVTFIEELPVEIITSIYHGSDIFVSYSEAATAEGFGFTIAEAMICGKAVVCSNIPAYAEVTANNALTVEPKRPKKLAKAFQDLLNNPDKAKNLALNGKTYALNNYTWSRHVEILEKVYERYLESKSGGE